MNKQLQDKIKERQAQAIDRKLGERAYFIAKFMGRSFPTEGHNIYNDRGLIELIKEHRPKIIREDYQYCEDWLKYGPGVGCETNGLIFNDSDFRITWLDLWMSSYDGSSELSAETTYWIVSPVHIWYQRQLVYEDVVTVDGHCRNRDKTRRTVGSYIPGDWETQLGYLETRAQEQELRVLQAKKEISRIDRERAEALETAIACTKWGL